MLRLVIQISMLLAIPMMAAFLFIVPRHCPWYISYVLVFNILVAPVFSAGALTSERERQTLELLLTTILQPWQIMWGKLLAGFRVSYVLTMFLMWPMVLAFVLGIQMYGSNWLAVVVFFLIVFVSAVFNSVSALFCSAICKRTSVAMLMSYAVLIVLYFLPVAAWYIGTSVFDDPAIIETLKRIGVTSPMMAAFWVPLDANILISQDAGAVTGDWGLVIVYFGFTLLLIAVMFAIIAALLRNRWGMTGR